ncbi:hypothetical protein [Pantoea agglomerans]|uniref:hypothetical protein n=1 Tax=Enterobacter agglomerans TaxID=549 RepID=UPI00320A3F52
MKSEEKQALIDFNRAVIAQHEAYAVPEILWPEEVKMLVASARIALAALTAEPVAYTDAEELETMRKGTFADMFTPHDSYKSDPQWIPLFTHPAPAVSLAELVPEKWTLKQAEKFVEDYTPPSEEEAVLFAVNSFRAAILRNIEVAD